MYRYQTTIYLKDTDATGVIYFSEQLKLALQAFESFLRPSHFSLKGLINSSYLLPIVHVESDYLAPLTVDDEVDVILYLHKIGTSSFTLSCDFFNKTNAILAGTAKITHVVTLKETKKSTPIPDELRVILLTLLPSLKETSC